MKSTAAGRRYNATKAAASAVVGASGRLWTTSNSPSKLSRSTKPNLATPTVRTLASSLTRATDGSTDAATRSSSRLSSTSSTTQAYSSSTFEFMPRYPPSNALPAIQSTSISHYVASSSRTRQLWDALVAGMVALASASWLVAATNDKNSSSARCEASPSRTVPATQSPDNATTSADESVLLAASATPAAAEAAPSSPTATVSPHANVVSFRPRWFNNILTSVGSSTSSSSTREGDDDSSSSSPILNQDARGVLLQSTGKPYDVSVRAIRGGRFTMEDEYFVANGGRFAAVFDGHGGSGVAQFLKKKLYAYVTHYLLVKHWEESEYDDTLDEPPIELNSATANIPNTNKPSVPPVQEMSAALRAAPMSTAASPSGETPQQILDRRRPTRSTRPSLSSHVSALRAAFEQIEQDVIADDNLEFQGSTAVAVILYESEDGHRTLLSANVGDSRAVLSRNGRAVDLTHDHKPNDEREKARIMAMGETIEWDQDCKVHRVRNLSLARAIGDRYAKPAVSPEVEIQHFPVVEDEDEFVVIASDGLWDVMTSQDAVSFVHDQMQKELSSDSMSKETADNYRLVLRRNMAKFLAREAIRKGSSDNVSVLMVWL